MQTAHSASSRSARGPKQPTISPRMARGRWRPVSRPTPTGRPSRERHAPPAWKPSRPALRSSRSARESKARLQQLAAGELVSRGSRGGSTASGAATNRASDALGQRAPALAPHHRARRRARAGRGRGVLRDERAPASSRRSDPSLRTSSPSREASPRRAANPPPEPVLAPGARVVVTLRPATKVEGAVEARILSGARGA